MSRKTRAAWAEMIKAREEAVKPEREEEKGPEDIKPVLFPSTKLKGRTLQTLLVSLAKNIKAEHMELSVELVMDGERLQVEIRR